MRTARDVSWGRDVSCELRQGGGADWDADGGPVPSSLGVRLLVPEGGAARLRQVNPLALFHLQRRALNARAQAQQHERAKGGRRHNPDRWPNCYPRH